MKTEIKFTDGYVQKPNKCRSFSKKSMEVISANEEIRHFILDLFSDIRLFMDKEHCAFDETTFKQFHDIRRKELFSLTGLHQ